MLNLSEYAANALLDGSDTMPATLYIGGHTDNPGPNGALNAGAETRRIATTRDAAVAGTATQLAGGSFTNATATESWTHVVLWDAPSGGNPWWIGELPSPVAVVVTETVRILPTLYTLSLSVWS